MAIFFISIGVNVFTDYLSANLTNYLSYIPVCLGLGFGLAVLVFVDLNAKYYNRGKTE